MSQTYVSKLIPVRKADPILTYRLFQDAFLNVTGKAPQKQ